MIFCKEININSKMAMHAVLLFFFYFLSVKENDEDVG